MKDNQFVVTGFDMIENITYIKTMTSSKGIEMTYQWLRRNIIRAPMRNKYANEVYNRFFLKGILATTINTDKFSKRLFISRNTLMKNLDILEKNGLIEKLDCDFKAHGEGQIAQKVYKLGTWKTIPDSDGEEHYKEFLKALDLITKNDIYGEQSE